MIPHNIGRVKLELAAANKKKVETWFRENPYGRQIECAAALGLSTITVSKHVQALRREHAEARQAALVDG